jgi:hypothetical protein
MGLFSIDLEDYPKRVNLAIGSLCLAWLLHYVFYFQYLFDTSVGMTRLDYIQIGVGVGICVMVAQIKRWARLMCLFFNIGMVGMYAFVTYAFHSAGGGKETALLTALVALLFGVSTYLLLDRRVAAFFRERNPLPERPNPEDLVIERLPPKKTPAETSGNAKKKNRKQKARG